MDVGSVNTIVNHVNSNTAADAARYSHQDDSRDIVIQEKYDNAAIDKEQLDKAIDFSNKVLFKNNTHLKFQVHQKTKDIMVKIVNDETGDVVKEIPPEKILDMVAKLWEIAGIIVDERR